MFRAIRSPGRPGRRRSTTTRITFTRTEYNASFLGFAPYTNPRVVIIVTISGTTGIAGFGGAAAGPVFEAAIGTALRHESIPRDVPEEIEEMEEKAAHRWWPRRRRVPRIKLSKWIRRNWRHHSRKKS